MPGHKGRSSIFEKYGFGNFARDLISHDITEILGADTLHDPRTVIKRVMDNYAELYGVLHTNLLVNGSSAGVMAAILSSVPRGGAIIMERNSHKSAFGALAMGGLRPIYVGSELVDIERAAVSNPDAHAIFITSPDYFGRILPVERIAGIAHSNGKILIVDQAHGAHLKFFDDVFGTRTAAENLGADIVIESTHKTLLSFTGTAIIHTCTNAVDISRLERFLSALQTTSPSYIMMDSLDINERIMRADGTEIASKWGADISAFCHEANTIAGLEVLAGGKRADQAIFGRCDKTKIMLSMRKLGIRGEALQEALMNRRVYPEMFCGDYVVIYTGAGNTKSDYAALYDALADIAKDYMVFENNITDKGDFGITDLKLEIADVPLDYESVPLYSSPGRVIYEPIIPFPPGIPIACPGEIISEELVNMIMSIANSGTAILGLDDEGEIKAGRI